MAQQTIADNILPVEIHPGWIAPDSYVRAATHLFDRLAPVKAGARLSARQYRILGRSDRRSEADGFGFGRVRCILIPLPLLPA